MTRALLLVVEAATFAVWVEVSLRVRPAGRVVGAFLVPTSPPIGRGAFRKETLAVSASELHRAIDRAYRRLPVEATCLKRALVLCRMRRRRRQTAQLRIGVKTKDGFSAHAWVEDGDGTVLTDPLEHFSPFAVPVQVDSASD
jgi:hypothetical protein